VLLVPFRPERNLSDGEPFVLPDTAPFLPLQFEATPPPDTVFGDVQFFWELRYYVLGATRPARVCVRKSIRVFYEE